MKRVKRVKRVKLDDEEAKEPELKEPENKEKVTWGRRRGFRRREGMLRATWSAPIKTQMLAAVPSEAIQAILTVPE